MLPASSMGYGVVALLGYFMLGEPVSPLRWLGIAVICLGVFVVGQTSPRSPERVLDRSPRSPEASSEVWSTARMVEAILFALIVVAGTGGELCVSRAMKAVGEVKDFRPLAIARVLLRAMRVGWLWAGISLMALAFSPC